MSTEWITPEQLSEMTGLSVSRLRNQRYERVVFPHYPIPGTREVVYDKAEVDKIIASSRIGTTEEKPVVAATGQTSHLGKDSHVY